MPATITVLYPDVDDATFDMAYYEGTHLPLVAKSFAPYGLSGYRSFSVKSSYDPSVKAPFSVQTNMEFNDAEGFLQAMKEPAGHAVVDNIKEYSNKEPVILVCTEVTKWEATS